MKEYIEYVMITPSYPPHVGGVERHVSEIHQALKRKRISGRIVVLNNPPQNKKHDKDIIWMPYRRFLGCVPKTAGLCTAIKLVRLLRTINPRVIHFHDAMTYPIMAVLKLLGLLKNTYITFHGWEGVFPPLPAVVRRRRKVAEIVKGSMAIGDFIKKWYGTASESVSYGGVSVESFNGVEIGNHDPDILRMAYFGRFEPDTGVLEMVEAVQKYRRQHDSRIKLDLYGMGSLRDRLIAICGNSSGGMKVHPQLDDISGVLPKYRVVVASGYLTIVEALCARRIVFAYYNNALREDYLRFHPASGAMFVCGGIDDFTAAISMCRANHEDAVARAKDGWEWARRQSWDAVAAKYIKLWRLPT